MTPAPGVSRFCERLRTHMRAPCLGQLGHLFTPTGIADDGEPRPDPATAAMRLDGAGS